MLNTEHLDAMVLGGLMADCHRYPLVATQVSGADFEAVLSRQIFDVMGELYQAVGSFESTLIIDALAERGLSGEDCARVLDIEDSMPTATRLDHHIALVHRRSSRRDLKRVIAQLREIEAEDEVENYRATAVELAASIGHGVTKRNLVPLQDLLAEFHEDQFKRIADPKFVRGVRTGLTDLDNKTTGFNPGELIIVAGRPGMGKSALLQTIALAVSHPQSGANGTVLWFSLEMQNEALIRRMVASQTGINSYGLRTGFIHSDDGRKITDSCSALNTHRIALADSGASSVSDIANECRQAAVLGPVSLVCIDYLQILDLGDDDTGGNQAQVVANATRKLKLLAKELGVPILLLSQLSRQVEHRTPPRPRLGDLRDSGAIEQDADLVLLLYRDDYYFSEDSETPSDRPGVAEIIVAKQRDGMTGTISCAFNAKTVTFHDLERAEHYPTHPDQRYRSELRMVTSSPP